MIPGHRGRNGPMDLLCGFLLRILVVHLLLLARYPSSWVVDLKRLWWDFPDRELEEPHIGIEGPPLCCVIEAQEFVEESR